MSKKSRPRSPESARFEQSLRMKSLFREAGKLPPLLIVLPRQALLEMAPRVGAKLGVKPAVLAPRSSTPTELSYGREGATQAVAHCDAGTKHGYSTLGGVIRRSGKVVARVMEECRDVSNSTEAEIFAVIRVLEKALALGIRSLTVFTDCRTILRHIAEPALTQFGSATDRLRKLACRFAGLVIRNIPRTSNKEADALARRARQMHRPDLAFA